MAGQQAAQPLVKRHPLPMFFVLAYLFFLISLVVTGVLVFQFAITPFVLDWCAVVGSWTPNLAALVVLWLTKAPGGMRGVAAGWLKWRVHPGWYLVGLMPLAISLAIAGGALALGSPAPGASAPLTAPTVVWLVVFSVIQGATGEELGWRGFALPRLQSRYGALVATVILGLLIAGWHSILHLFQPAGVPEWQFWLVMVAYCVVVTWSFNRTGGSLLIVSLLHFSFNFGAKLVLGGLGLVSMQSLFWGYIAVYGLAALGIILAEGPTLGQKAAVGAHYDSGAPVSAAP